MSAAQLALDMEPRLTPQQQQVLDMLTEADGAWISGVTFINAHILSYSQRVGNLRRLGYPVESTGRGRVARYRLAVRS